jgi:type IV leader peptidase family protein
MVGPLAPRPAGWGKQRGDLGPRLVGELVAADHATSHIEKCQPPKPTARAVRQALAGQGLGWAVPAYLAFAFVCLVLAVIDAATRLLPNRVTYPAFPVVAGLLLAASLGLGDLGRLGRGLLAAASVGGLFLLLALLFPHGVGVGDVKLAPTWAWRWAGCRGGRWRWGCWPPSCSAAWRGWAACWHLACRARRCCRSDPGWSSVRCWAS